MVVTVCRILVFVLVWNSGGSSIWWFCVLVSFRDLVGIAFVHLLVWAARLCQSGWKEKKHIIIHNSYNAWWPITVLGCWFLCFRFCFVLCCLSRCFYFLFFFHFFGGKGEGVPTEKLSIRQMRKQLSRSSSSIHARNILDTVYLLSR